MHSLADFTERQDLTLLLIDSTGQVLAAGGAIRREMGLPAGIHASIGVSGLLSGPQGCEPGDLGLLALLKESAIGASVECRIATNTDNPAWVAVSLVPAASRPPESLPLSPDRCRPIDPLPGDA